jgi:hypothetical protein
MVTLVVDSTPSFRGNTGSFGWKKPLVGDAVSFILDCALRSVNTRRCSKMFGDANIHRFHTEKHLHATGTAGCP